MYFRLVRKYPALDAIGNHPFQSFDLRFIALVKRPLFDAFGFYETRLQEDFHMLAGGGLAHSEFFGNENATNAVLHQIPIHLRPKVFSRVLQPIEDLQAAVIRQGPERKFHFHIDN
jgi:hypothetical protein